jgi:hypothetical protein
MLLYGYDRNKGTEEPLKKYLTPDDYHRCEGIVPDGERCPSSTYDDKTYSCFYVEGGCYDSCEVLLVFLIIVII